MTADFSTYLSRWSMSFRSSTSKKIWAPGNKLVKDRLIRATCTTSGEHEMRKRRWAQ